ncbi:hypothetical protein D3Z36_14480 [Lachnospiraceae bacterium]|nr:hypothetical protein [Lachnospiraceae bacterium]
MAGYDGSIRINTAIDQRGFNRGARGLVQGMTRLGSSLRGIIGSLGFGLGIAGLVALGKQAIDTASDIQEVQNVVDTAFGSMSYKMEEFAKTSVKQFGISQLSAKQLGSTFMAMGASMLDSAENASDMAINLTARAADMASFYNKSIEETSTALKSIYTGETETLKEYGVVMTQVNLEEFARQQGINKSIQAMEQAEKVELQYAYVMQQTSLAAGDFARTSDSWANQTRILSEQFKELLSVLGTGLITALTPVVKFLNNVLTMLIAIAKQIGTILSKLFGIKIPTADSGKLASDMSAAAGGADALAGGMDAAGSAAKKAGKEASKALAPFDKLKVLSKDSGSGGGSGSDSGGGGAGAGGGFEIPELSFKEDAEEAGVLGSALDRILKRLKELKGLFVNGFFDGLGDYKTRLEELKKDIASIGKELKEIFTDPGVVAAANRFADQLALTLGQITGSIASIGLTIAQLLVGGIEKYLTQNTDRIKQYIIGMFDIGTDILAIIGDLSVALADIFSVFGGDTAQQIAGNIIGIFAEIGMLLSENALKLGRDILNMIAQPIIDNKEKIKTAIEGTLEAIEPFTSGLLTAVQDIRDAVSEIYDEHLKPLFDSISEGLSTVLGKLLDGYNKYIVPVLQGLGDKFKEIMEGPFGETVDKVKDFIGKLIDAIKLFWEEVLVPFFSWIANNIMPVLAPIIDFIGKTVLSVFKTIIKIVGNIADSLGGIIDFVVGAFTGNWKKAWEGIKKFFGGTWQTILDILSMNWEFIQNIVKNGVELVKVLITAAWERVEMTTSIVWTAIKGVVSTVFRAIKSVTSTALRIIQSAIDTAWNAIKSVTSTVWDGAKGIKNIVNGVWSFFKNNVSKIFDGVKEKISGAWDSIKSKTSKIWSSVNKSVSDVWNYFKDNVSNIFVGVKNTIAGAWDGIKQKTEEIWDSVSQKISGVLGSIKKVVSDVFGWISNMIEKIIGRIKEISTSATSVIGGGVGGAIGGIAGGRATYYPAMASTTNMQIPQLASGAVIRGGDPFLAVLGDQRHGQTNIETPLPTMVKAFKQAIAEIGGMGGGEYTFVAQLDGKTIFEETVKQNNIYVKKTGRSRLMY